MRQILLTLGGLTLGGSAAVVLLALAGRSTRGRYGARWRCWGWLLLCVRLAVPLPLVPHVQAPAPIQMEVPAPSAVTQSPAVPGPSGEVSTPPVQEGSVPPNTSGAAPAASPPATPARPGWRPTPEQIALSLWLLGAVAVLAWNTAVHLRFLRYLRRWETPVSDSGVIQVYNQLGDRLELHSRPRLLTCPGLKAPMLAGIFRPAVLLPQENMENAELACALLHELTHYRRRDVWLKALALWVNALYWFNPLMWYMIRLMERDTELACDEDALRRLPRSACTTYGQTVLDAVARLQNKEKGESSHASQHEK